MPAAPAFARPVTVAQPKVGEDLLIVAARERAGRAKANETITCFVEWYRIVVASYGRQAAEASASQALHTCEEK